MNNLPKLLRYDIIDKSTIGGASMIIHAGKYILRSFEYTEKDIRSFYEISHDAKVKKYVPYTYSKNYDDAKETVKAYSGGDCKNDFYLCIQDKTGTVVGAIIAIRMITTVLDVSVLIATNYRGKGIMQIAMNSFITWLKKNTKYTQLSLVIEKSNNSSKRLAEKIGAEIVGELPNNRKYKIRIK